MPFDYSTKLKIIYKGAENARCLHLTLTRLDPKNKFTGKLISWLDKQARTNIIKNDNLYCCSLLTRQLVWKF